MIQSIQARTRGVEGDNGLVSSFHRQKSSGHWNVLNSTVPVSQDPIPLALGELPSTNDRRRGSVTPAFEQPGS